MMQWYRIIIDDHASALGKGFLSLLERTLEHAPSSFVIVTRLEAVGGDTRLPIVESEIGTVESLIASLKAIMQLVWGRFFFFDTSESAKNAVGKALEEQIAGSTVTICAVDNSSCFVFTKSPALVSELLTHFERVEVMKADLARILRRPEDF
jgi:hypothetical protein